MQKIVKLPYRETTNAKKKCSTCVRFKPYDDFPRSAKSRDGYAGQCYSCHNEYKRVRYRESLESRASILCKKALNRSKGKELSADINTKWVLTRLKDKVCEETGAPFDFSAKATFYSPSLSRIDHTKGYLKSNVKVTCWGLNVMMGTWGEEILMRFLLDWYLPAKGYRVTKIKRERKRKAAPKNRCSKTLDMEAWLLDAAKDTDHDAYHLIQ